MVKNRHLFSHLFIRLSRLAESVGVKTIEISSSTKGRKRFSTAGIVTPGVNGSMSCRRCGYEDGASLVQTRPNRTGQTGSAGYCWAPFIIAPQRFPGNQRAYGFESIPDLMTIERLTEIDFWRCPLSAWGHNRQFAESDLADRYAPVSRHRHSQRRLMSARPRSQARMP